MYDFDDEFYNEPSEFDMQVDEFKQSLMNAVKEEYKTEMERLRKENAELQEVKQNLDQIKREYNQKVVELDMAKRNLKNEVRRERLKELMGDFRVELFRAYSKYREPRPCEKCNNTRYIKYKTPLGRDASEKCDCNTQEIYYEPKEFICSSFEVQNGKINAWYRELGREYDGMEFSFASDSIHPRNIYTGQEFSEIKSHYDMFFKTKDECQAYCDWLTAAANKEATHG
ncbi:hypothetical protein BCV73_08770 [Paenibacillus sp. SSG-1]|uniref:hypothetical protein n=1 Tax=Paenibacillus sp. SSG-1 TaxID=1443669 RepID=UPI000B7CC20B|nr:hypothetical protein [Paenibacillus sp. SSG-1]OXL83160.1 hypothetical protein BCV73_08770 [Paenibacillus sp. SSG-1]